MSDDKMNPSDWNDLRQYMFTESDPPAEWPTGVKPISLSGVNFFGLDKDNRLHWDGKRVEFRQGIRLTTWQSIFAILGSLGIVANALIMADRTFWMPM